MSNETGPAASTPLPPSPSLKAGDTHALGASVPDASTLAMVVPDIVPNAERPGGAVVPGYALLGELGRGGMGVVYKARQVKANRVVALKMILAGAHAGVADLARFQTEAEAIARLQHPNIVQVYEVGEHDGKPFFSLEYCGGASLEKKLNGTPLPPQEAAALLVVLARAMQAAHDKGIIHRDLKPANVLLTEEGTPKITDFGLAKKLDEVGQTHSGAIMGTPSYMAPEQAGGKSGAIGPSADVYALGAILYECLTGRPPFKAAAPLDTILQVVNDEPVPPRQLQSQTPRDLETIALQCLRKDPKKRYGTAAALADDLGRWGAGEPIRARPVGAVELVWKWAKRRPAVAALVAGNALALLTLVGGGLWDNHRLQRSLSETIAANTEIERLQKKERQLLEERLQEANHQLSLQNLRSLAVAMHNYHDTMGRLPAAAIYGRDGKPLLSWRVALLPFLGQEGEDLYKRFKLDEAWDSPHNRGLMQFIPKVYAPAEGTVQDPAATYFQVFTGPGTAFEGRQGRRLPADFPDGMSNTFLVVEAGEPVEWTKPLDLSYVPGSPLPKLGGLHPKNFHAVLADGMVRQVAKDTDDAVIRAYITRNGGETLLLPPARADQGR